MCHTGACGTEHALSVLTGDDESNVFFMNQTCLIHRIASCFTRMRLLHLLTPSLHSFVHDEIWCGRGGGATIGSLVHSSSTVVHPAANAEGSRPAVLNAWPIVCETDVWWWLVMLLSGLCMLALPRAVLSS